MTYFSARRGRFLVRLKSERQNSPHAKEIRRDRNKDKVFTEETPYVVLSFASSILVLEFLVTASKDGEESAQDRCHTR